MDLIYRFICACNQFLTRVGIWWWWGWYSKFTMFAAVTTIDTSGTGVLLELKKTLEKRSLQVGLPSLNWSLKGFYLLGMNYTPYISEVIVCFCSWFWRAQWVMWSKSFIFLKLLNLWDAILCIWALEKQLRPSLLYSRNRYNDFPWEDCRGSEIVDCRLYMYVHPCRNGVIIYIIDESSSGKGFCKL